jgi:hypothetical protein
VPIVLKKSKMPRQQDSRKSESIADFGWLQANVQAPGLACGKVDQFVR